MFGRRKDGKKIKGIDGFFRMASLVVGENRCYSTNYYTQEVTCKEMDEFIAAKRAEGIEYTYRDIVVAALVRIFYLRPALNRFVYKGTFYQRNHIDISLVMHKNLRTGEQETSIKCRFTGKETIAEIKEKFDVEIHKAIYGSNDVDAFTGGFLGKMPTWAVRLLVHSLRRFDRWGMLSDKFMFDISPFHASVVFADMKSVHLGPVWHHLYNFGNCGFICCMGKERMKAIVDPKTNAVKAEKVLELGIGEDERFIDGLTYSHAIKTIMRLVGNLTALERAPEDDEIKRPHPTPYEKKKAEKAAKKAAKKHKHSA
jgi:hypothetical protein